MSKQIKQQVEVPLDIDISRLDLIASHCFPQFSRAKLQEWIRLGALLVDGKKCKPKDKVFGGEVLLLNVEIESCQRWLPENIPLNIVFEDDDILVLNKPAGLVVHPAAGNLEGTLLNALLFYCADLASVPRAGIVHRLDKDTTGLMVVAKNLTAHFHLVEQLQERTVTREYDAITQGEVTTGGHVDEPIGRDPKHRIKMAVRANGKSAVTHFRVQERFHHYTHIRCRLETGRTHQIRVHMSHIDYPLVGDPVYNKGLKVYKDSSDELKNILRNFQRQALHASLLELQHPVTNEKLRWEIPVADDLDQLLICLREDFKQQEDALNEGVY